MLFFLIIRKYCDLNSRNFLVFCLFLLLNWGIHQLCVVCQLELDTNWWENLKQWSVKHNCRWLSKILLCFEKNWNNPKSSIHLHNEINLIGFPFQAFSLQHTWFSLVQNILPTWNPNASIQLTLSSSDRKRCNMKLMQYGYENKGKLALSITMRKHVHSICIFYNYYIVLINISRHVIK